MSHGENELGSHNGPNTEGIYAFNKVISVQGDLIIEYIAPGDSTSTSRRWQVASELLSSNSPYFHTLLDPMKFSEGRQFNAQKQAWNEAQGSNSASQHMLPTVRLPGGMLTSMCGEDAIELFLQILCVNCLNEEDTASFEHELKSLSTSLVARLIDLADSFNSPRIVQDILRQVGYSYGKTKPSLIAKLSVSSLQMKEDRIRQIILISAFLNDSRVTKIMTHALLVIGSRFWINGLEHPEEGTLRWRYLPNGLEEEIYYRRQCVLNTITDLQAYFLRVYGGLEDPDGAKAASNTRTPGAAFTTSAPLTVHLRQFQCRGGLNNASQCDLFQLGQMTRFFSLRAKTIFLGSTLIDPDFSATPNEDGHVVDQEINGHSSSKPPAGPPSDITAIIASLKQYPDYPIDEAHSGCGVRRRIMAPLECIEKFVWDDRGLLGIMLPALNPLVSDISHPARWIPWADLVNKKQTVEISFARVTAVHYPSTPQKNQLNRSTPQEEVGRLLFTAAKRDWTASSG
ncbi:hypothetical protein PENARI_c010G04194 [Penicillium arizonense]|uniref:BTB domain-containing protein n=1 Tax=Penicillium arizonense TaxID=1835702 RepID=A0A1F5LHK8_PENAI|nr:hypothetical protein PENARI_c010G04194 [Penicillium arizonense]OGE52500.1 hypothetical protein PENARI_c010G04194 [Penicillium arizonense]